MAGNIKLEIVTPSKSVVDDDAQIIVAPGTLGEFGVMIGHTPFLSSLKVGAIRYKDKGGTERVIFVSGGFAEVLPDKVTILAESAERRKDISIERAKSAFERAKRRLENEDRDIDFERAKAALERALYRLRILESPQAM